MLGILTLAFLVAGAVLLARREGIRRASVEDPAELEAAEREVRDLPAAGQPDDDSPGDDWGPGAPGGAAR